uniref:Uncharacterized protein n=1 Tax=Lepeophtheirus salmonis TaxID=72036 RepID=A0A0K2UDB4_LEPSM
MKRPLFRTPFGAGSTVTDISWVPYIMTIFY